MTLKQALETMLVLAQNKLTNAIEKNKEWDINHYKNDVKFIKQELKIVTQKN